MFRGFVSGTFWGLVFGAFCVVVSSLAAPQPAGNAPPAPPQTDVPVAEAAQTPATTPPEAAPATGAGVALGAAPQVVAPDETIRTPTADTTAPSRPSTVTLEADLSAPTAGDTPDLAAEPVSPVLPNPQAQSPQSPETEADVVVSTDPAEPTPVIVVEDQPDPVVAEEAPAALPTPEAAPLPETEEVLITPEMPDEEAAPTLEEPLSEATAEPALPSAGDTAPVAEAIRTPEVPVAPEVPDAPETPEVPEADQEVATAPELVVPDPVQDPVADSADDAGADAAAAEAAPETSAPTAPDAADSAAPVVTTIVTGSASPLPSGDGRVIVNRALTPDGTEEEAAAAEPAPEPPLDPDAPALERYAAGFDNPEGKPMMALVLLDDGNSSLPPAALGSLPFAVTVAVDPGLTTAADRAAAYRAAGQEVAVLANLPDGAQASDLEIALEASFAILPEAVALVDVGAGGLQGNRGFTNQAVAALQERGRGLVTQSQGLNMAQRAAEAAGLPVGVIYRDLDAEDQDASVIRRFLDQAAFRARQDGGVVLVARLRPDTLSALTLWGTANRAGQVTMAPVSAYLTQPDG